MNFSTHIRWIRRDLERLEHLAGSSRLVELLGASSGVVVALLSISLVEGIRNVPQVVLGGTAGITTVVGALLMAMLRRRSSEVRGTTKLVKATYGGALEAANLTASTRESV